MRRFAYLLIIFIFSTLIFSCNSDKKKQKLIIFHAGSLSIPFKQMKTEFEKANPNIEILLEAAGSVKCARKITDLKKECDIIASADYTIIDQMLIPDFTSWNIKFASNEMTIAYHKQSKHSEIINSKNWFEILLRDDVIFGRSDPNSDPCGYRAVLTTQLAEDYYNNFKLSEKFISKNQEYIRPKETDLLALLESKTIDYIFLYRSVAQQHGLNYITLPDSINLKKTDLQEYYQNASVNILGKQPGTTTLKKGQPMVYGITVLDNAPNRDIAIQFVDFVLSQQGGVKIMEKNGQPSVVPSQSNSYKSIPKKLKKYAHN